MQVTDEMVEAACLTMYEHCDVAGHMNEMRAAIEAALGERQITKTQATQAIMSMVVDIDDQRACIEELAEALKPFASFADLVDGDPAASPTGDLCPLTLDYDRINDGRIVSLGDCRRASATLKRWGLK